MPYIPKENRQTYDPIIKTLNAYFTAEGFTGNLNYILFKIAKKNCHRYKDYAAFLGELEAAKLEIYRRLAAPYEDKKIIENGDVTE